MKQRGAESFTALDYIEYVYHLLPMVPSLPSASLRKLPTERNQVMFVSWRGIEICKTERIIQGNTYVTRRRQNHRRNHHTESHRIQSSSPLPSAVSPHAHGRIGSLFESFLYRTDRHHPSKIFLPNIRHANTATTLASTRKVPHTVLPRANDLWRRFNSDGTHYDYDGSCKLLQSPRPDPFSYFDFDQDLGLIISTATAASSHILRTH